MDDPALSMVGGEPLTPEVAQRLPVNVVVWPGANRDESHLTWTRFGQILGRIKRLAWHPT